METADKDGEQGCMRAVERPPLSNVACVCLHYESWAPYHRNRCPFQRCLLRSWNARLCGHRPWSFIIRGHNVEVIFSSAVCLSRALQDSRSHLSALFSWWDIFKGHHSYETGPSFMFMAAVFLGRCILLVPLTPFSICHQPIKPCLQTNLKIVTKLSITVMDKS